MNKPLIKINIPSIIISLALLGILTYITIDAFIVQPNIKYKFEEVSTDFDSLSVYLETKIPKLDSAVEIHSSQIADQNKQLEELNELTKALKE